MFAYIRAIYNRLVATIAIVYNVYPRSATTVSAAAVTMTATATAWVYGSYAQIVAATAASCQFMGFTLENFTGAASQGEVQIATGGAGSEVVFGTWQVTVPEGIILTGLNIPVGTRIAARYRTSTGAADTVDIKVNVLEGGN